MAGVSWTGFEKVAGRLFPLWDRPAYRGFRARRLGIEAHGVLLSVAWLSRAFDLPIAPGAGCCLHPKSPGLHGARRG